MARSTVFRNIRIAALLYVLLFVAVAAWISRAAATDWDDTLYVNLYPVNGDGSEEVAAYIARLDGDAFRPIELYLQAQAENYGHHPRQALDITLGPELGAGPPAPPPAGNVLQVMAWSLHLRWWSWRATREDGIPTADIQIYLQYFRAEDELVLEPSTGLQKGLVGIVNAFAERSMNGANNVVITHELLHTLGASDKYDPATTLPLAPGGLADPERSPLYPQPAAEIMAGRIAVTPLEARMPDSLAETLIGPLTAAEIGLVR